LLRLLIQNQLDVSDDGFLSLMADDGETKDDVKVPDGEVGEKIDKLFTQDEKDTSKPAIKLGENYTYDYI
jgi:hypothetical protein